MLFVGIVVGVIVALATPSLIESILPDNSTLKHEAVWSTYILSIALPVVVITAGMIGILQAHQKFKQINLVRIPLGLINFIGPVVVLKFTDSLIMITVVLAISRLIASFIYLTLCKQVQANFLSQPNTSWANTTGEIIKFGGWITVSNVIGPVMVYFDRLFIAGIIGLVAVTYYTTPYEIITRLWIFPGAVADVIFPALAAALSIHAIHARSIYISAIISQAVIMFPIIALITLFSSDLLLIWLGQEFAENSYQVLNWLALGVYINAFARMPYSLIQSAGRPDITAKIHLLELPFYLLLLVLLLIEMGIIGAAIVWTLRIAIDTLLLFYFASHCVPDLKNTQYRAFTLLIVSSCLICIFWFEINLDYRAWIATVIVITTLLTAGILLKKVSHISVAGRSGTSSSHEK